MPEKAEDVCPHLCNVSNDAVVRTHGSVIGQDSHLPNTVIVAIVSTDVIITKILAAVF